MTIGLIAINVLVYLNQLTLAPRAATRFVYYYGLIPSEIAGGDLIVQHPIPVYATILTSMFVHGGLFHLAGNMLYLWIFGDNVEDRMGRLTFLIFYLASGLAGAVAQTWSNPDSTIPMVGASGAVSGVLGAYLILYPHARVMTLIVFGWIIRMVEIPALVVLGFWIVVQVLSGLLTLGAQGGGVAWFAHVGGFAGGLLMVYPLTRRRARMDLEGRLS